MIKTKFGVTVLHKVDYPHSSVSKESDFKAGDPGSMLGWEDSLEDKVSQDPKGTGWGWRTRVPRESQPCPHSPEPAPLLGQGPTAGIWVELGPSCFWRCLRLDSGCLTGSPAMVHEASGNRAVLFWDGDGAPGRLAAAEISAPLVCNGIGAVNVGSTGKKLS